MNDSDDESTIEHLLRESKKRKMIALVVAAVAIFETKRKEKNSVEPPRKKFKVVGKLSNKIRDRSPVRDLIYKIAVDEPRLFKRMYRMDPAIFFGLVDKISPHICKNQNHTKNPIPPEVYLAITLRWLAGGSYLDLAFGYNIPHTSLHHYIKKVLHVLDTVIDNIKFPINDIEKLQNLSEEFDVFTSGNFPGTVAAGDGIVFKMQKPTNEEAEGSVSSFFTRKGYYAFGLQAFCDAKCRFLSICSKVCSSTHDATAYIVTTLKRLINEGHLPQQFHLVLDEAYPCLKQELSPWKGQNLPLEKDAFNMLLSKQRQCIERAFGILIKRWGIFWRELTTDLDLIPLIISVCCKLHNYIIDEQQEANGDEDEIDNIDSYVVDDEQQQQQTNKSKIIRGINRVHDAKDNTEPLYTDGTGMTKGFRSDFRCMITHFRPASILVIFH